MYSQRYLLNRQNRVEMGVSLFSGEENSMASLCIIIVPLLVSRLDPSMLVYFGWHVPYQSSIVIKYEICAT
jgi:hypothetical protein